MTRQEFKDFRQNFNDFDYVSDLVLIERKKQVEDLLSKKSKEELKTIALKNVCAHYTMKNAFKWCCKEIDFLQRKVDEDGVNEEVAKLMKENRELKERLSKVIDEKDKLDDEVSFLRERNEILERKGK